MRKFLTLMIMLLGVCRAFALADPVDPAALAGETLYFKIYWAGIPAAEATIKAEKISDDRMNFSVVTDSYPAISLLYPIHSRVDSLVAMPGLVPVSFKRTGTEGWGTQFERDVQFDLVANEAKYYKNSVLTKTLKIPPGTQDPFSCFYFYRAQKITDDEPVKVAVSDGRKMVEGEVSIVGREKITTPAGTFSTIIIHPKMEGIGGVFAKTPNAKVLVWLTDDEFRRPVKLESKVIVGSFTAILQRFDQPLACQALVKSQTQAASEK